MMLYRGESGAPAGRGFHMHMAAFYIFVQIVAYGTDIGTFLVLHELMSIPPVPSNVLAKFIGGLVSFFSHRHITFKSVGEASLGRQFFKFWFFWFLNSAVASFLLVFISKAIENASISKVISDIMLVVVSFYISKKIVFK